MALPLIAAELRIGVLSLFRPERITVRSSEPLWVQAGGRSFFLAPGQVAGLRAVGPEIDLFAQQQASTSTRVTISGRGGAPATYRLGIEGKLDRTFTGRLDVKAIASRLEPVILVDLEAAVAAVVAAEVPADTPPEALKAMAVLARSYYIAGARRHGAYDFCDTTHCQWRRETIAASHPATAATQATEGIVLARGDKVLPAMYHASCGGRTKSSTDIGLKDDDYPYTPVDCEACRRDAPIWTRKLPAAVAAPLINSPSESKRLKINREQGSKTLPSNTYKAAGEGDSVIFEGRGDGHGLGVCQKGIIALAAAGADFRTLLSRYLPQTRTIGAK
ncbi:MAG TPA: SpoIID/LytB domain-containing protein, partial [Bryobacteraceae bacterium]|nr:SpoIID/LytB domain-containing protein [Bryobacteraceae bacterium]